MMLSRLEKLEAASCAMQRRWYELVQAEQRGATREVFECMYDAYMRSVEEFNRCSELLAHQQQRDHDLPIPPSHQRIS